MADTITTQVTDSDWTEIQQGIAGLITNHAFQNVQIREASAKPDASVKIGHVIRPRENLTYGLSPGQKIFARTDSGVADLVLTEGT